MGTLVKSTKEIEMNAKLFELLNVLRGSLLVEDAMQFCLALAVFAKKSPESFDKLYKEPKATQKNLLYTLLASDIKLNKVDSLESLKVKHLMADVLQNVVYAVNEITNYSAFADAALEAIATYSGKRGEESLTNATIVKLIKKFVGNTKELAVYDATAGYAHLASALDCKSLRLEDVSIQSREIGKNILILKDIDAHYELNNSLLTPFESALADLVITQPPFGVHLNSSDLHILENAQYLQFGKGERIPATASGALWIQHTLFNMNETGRAIMLLPHGLLFRGGYDARLREYLLDNDLIEAIIGLKAGLLQNTNIQTMLLILNKKKSDQMRGTVHFVDASDLGQKEKNKGKTMLKVDEIDLIASLAMGMKPDHKCFKAVLLPEIHHNQNDLTIKRYIFRDTFFEIPDLNQEQVAIKLAQAAFISAQTRLLNLLADTTSAKH